MPDPLTVRGSRLPLAMLCPGSIRGGLGVDPVHPLATQGSALHYVMEAIVRDRLENLPADFESRCQSFNVDPEDIRDACLQAMRVWLRIRDDYPDPQVETALSCRITDDFVLTTHPDVYSIVDPGDGKTITVRVADWKSGFSDSDHSDQVYAGWAAVSSLIPAGKSVRFEADIVRCRINAHDQMYSSEQNLHRWLTRVRDHVFHWDGAFHPGPHCHRCPMSLACDAKGEMVKGLVRDLTGDDDTGMNVAMAQVQSADADMQRKGAAHIFGILEMAKVLNERANMFRSIIKNSCAETGPIPISDTKQWSMVKTTRTSINLGRGQDILKRFSNVYNNAWISRTSLTNAVRGTGTDVDALLGELDRSGAMRQTKTDSMRVVNLAPKSKNHTEPNDE